MKRHKDSRREESHKARLAQERRTPAAADALRKQAELERAYTRRRVKALTKERVRLALALAGSTNHHAGAEGAS